MAEPRVLFLAHQLGPGGVSVHMNTLGERLLARGWRVALASRGAAGKHSHGPEWFESHGIRHFPVAFPVPAARPGFLGRSLAALGRLRKVVRQFRPDLIHVHWRSASPYARALQSLCGVPFVTSLHVEGIPSHAIARMGSFWGERTIAISQETRED